MLHVRVRFAHAAELRRVFTEEMRRGVMLLQIAPPEGLDFRTPLTLEIASPGGAMAVQSEVVSILPGVGVAVAFPPDKLDEANVLLSVTPDDPQGPTSYEIVASPDLRGDRASGTGPVSQPGGWQGGGATPSGVPSAQPPASPGGTIAAVGTAAWARAGFAEKVQTALHGTKDDRSAILRDQNKQLHPFVLKSPHVSPEEVAGWAANAQMSSEFLKLISEKKEWFTRPAIALALARNPKTPADIAVRAVDYLPAEMLRQMAKGMGALPHVVQAARKKILPK